ncbi:MAG: sigma-70 family RNA polymerase sigma factor [Planctomycetes bacterium]|nr:sigma-70 family RNA polymerase sigma factor [Planctomycetota bacterium]
MNTGTHSSSVDAPPEFGADAYEAITHKARRLIGHYGFTATDRHDLEQELAQRLLIALKAFDPKMGNRRTYIAGVLDRAIFDVVRTRTAPMRDYRRAVGMTDMLDESSDDEARGAYRGAADVIDPRAERDFDHCDVRMDVEGAMVDLPDDLRQLCLQLQTMSVLEVARETGTTRHRVYQAIARLRVHFTHAGLAP